MEERSETFRRMRLEGEIQYLMWMTVLGAMIGAIFGMLVN